MLHKIYNALFCSILKPLIQHYLCKRAQKNPDYLQDWAERFGEPYPNPIQNAIWIHAVSVGETRAAQPLIIELQKYFPDSPLLITQMTPTGRATAQQLYPHAQCRYLPYDNPKWVQQFIREHRPKLGILMETEIWVNLIHACAAENVPLFLANARLSEKSERGYWKIRGLVAPALAKLSGCYAQTIEDAERLEKIGVKNPLICGNTKFDITPSAESTKLANEFRARIGNRRVFLAASTREKDGVDEAQWIVQAWKKIAQSNDLLIIVPRHLERFQAAFDFATQAGLPTQKRSDNQIVQPKTQVWIGDSMGEMFAYYQAADLVFVGGSLVETGCQNVIEPMSCGKPVLFGQSTFNFQAACDWALMAGAAKQLNTAEEVVQTACNWLHHPHLSAPIAQSARDFVAQHHGASAKMAQEIHQIITKIAKDQETS